MKDLETLFGTPSVEGMRRKRGSKWTRYPGDVIPCWVADTDFPLADPIQAALERTLSNGDFGYSRKMQEGPIPEVYAAWAKRRFDLEVDPTQVVGLVDVVQGIYITVREFAKPGEGVATLTPVYPPFLTSVRDSGRRLVGSAYVQGSDRYEIDFDHLAASLDDSTRVFLLCNPHNPTGRCMTREELERIAELVLARRDLVVLADEIHADLVYEPHQHIPFSSLSPEIAARTITMTSATKSFNVAGMRFAIAVFGSEALRATFDQVPERVRGGLNSLGVYATEAAWTHCDDWLEGLRTYLRGNRDYLVDFVNQRLPGVNILEPEATFLSWLDCRELDLQPNAFDFFLEHAGVAMSDGEDFGEGGSGFVRLNFATSRDILEQILTRMERALSQ